MNTWLLCSALFTLVTSLVHSVLGEQRTLRHPRASGRWIALPIAAVLALANIA